MRYLFGFLCVCALVGTSPLSVSVQAGEEHSLSFWHDEALKIALFSSCPPPPPRTPDGYTLEEMELRVRRARIGLLSTTGVTVVGAVLFGVGAARAGSSQDLDALSEGPLVISGMSLMISGAVGMIATGIMLGFRKGELRKLQEARYEGPRRVQWNLAQSRLVF